MFRPMSGAVPLSTVGGARLPMLAADTQGSPGTARRWPVVAKASVTILLLGLALSRADFAS